MRPSGLSWEKWNLSGQNSLGAGGQSASQTDEPLAVLLILKGDLVGPGRLELPTLCLEGRG